MDVLKTQGMTRDEMIDKLTEFWVGIKATQDEIVDEVVEALVDAGYSTTGARSMVDDEDVFARLDLYEIQSVFAYIDP